MYDGPHEVGDLDRRDPALVHRLDQVAHVQHADDLVERAAVDGIARVRRLEHRLSACSGGKLDGERDDLGPRHHDVADLLVGEVEDLVEHLLLALLDLAPLGRLADEHPQLGLRVDGCPRRPAPRGRRARARTASSAAAARSAARRREERAHRRGDPRAPSAPSGRARSPWGPARRSRRGRTSGSGRRGSRRARSRARGRRRARARARREHRSPATSA